MPTQMNRSTLTVRQTIPRYRKSGTDLHECSCINRLQFASRSFSGSPTHSCRGFLHLSLLEYDERFRLQCISIDIYAHFQIRVLDRFHANRSQIYICPLIHRLIRRIIDEYSVNTIKVALFPYGIS